MEPRARVSVWPGRRRVPGIVAPDSWGARGAECLPRDVLRRSSPATSPCDGTTARRCLCHGTGSGTTEARPPASSVPPAPHGGLGGLSRHPANSGPDFRSSSSSFLPEKRQAEGDIVNCEGVPGKTGSLSVSSYSPHSMMAIHYAPLWPLRVPLWPLPINNS